MEREALRERVAKNLLRYQGTDHARQIAERDFSEASGVVRITEDQLREIDDAGIYEVYYHYDYDHWIIQKRPVISITPKQIRIAKKWDDGYRVLPRQRIEGGEVVEVKQQSYGSGRTTRRLLKNSYTSGRLAWNESEHITRRSKPPSTEGNFLWIARNGRWSSTL